MHDGGQVFVDRYCNQLIPCKKRKSKGRFAGNRKYASAPAPRHSSSKTRQASPAGRGPAGKPAPRAPVPDSQHPQPVEGAVVLVRPRALVALQVLDVLDHLDRASGGTLSLRLCRGSPSKSKSQTDSLQRSRGAEGTPPRQAPPFSGHARSTGTFPGQGSSPSHGRGLSCRTDKARSLARRAPGGVWLSPGRSWSRSGCKELRRQDDQHSWPTPHVPRGALLPKPRRGRTSAAPRAPGAPLLGPEASGASCLTSWGWGAAASGFLPPTQPTGTALQVSRT